MTSGDGRLPKKVRGHILSLIFLLENLGFIVHPGKAITTPTQEIEFSGYRDTHPLTGAPPPGSENQETEGGSQQIGKSKATLFCSGYLEGAREDECSVTSCSTSTPFLQTFPERHSNSVREGQPMLQCSLPTFRGRADLNWWTHYLPRWSGKSLLLRKPDVAIESDASLTGWGATSQGLRTGGPLSPSERSWHIKCLEILAATLAVKTFLKHQTSKHVLLHLDNMTAVAYINNMGGTVSPQANTPVRDLWMWCLEKNVLLLVQHLPSKLNMIADLESRMMRDRSYWMLNPRIFQKIQVTIGWSYGGRPICILANESTALTLLLETRPSGRGNRCIPPGLDKSKELCQSPLESNRKGSGQGETTGSKSDTNSSCMDISIMVSLLLNLLQDFLRKIQPQQDMVWEVRTGSLPEILP